MIKSWSDAAWEDSALADMEGICNYIAIQLQAPENVMGQYNRIAAISYRSLLIFYVIEDMDVKVTRVLYSAKLFVLYLTRAEPKDYEIYDFVLKDYDQLRFSLAVADDIKEACRNPKRVQREVRKQQKKKEKHRAGNTVPVFPYV